MWFPVFDELSNTPCPVLMASSDRTAPPPRFRRNWSGCGLGTRTSACFAEAACRDAVTVPRPTLCRNAAARVPEGTGTACLYSCSWDSWPRDFGAEFLSCWAASLTQSPSALQASVSPSISGKTTVALNCLGVPGPFENLGKQQVLFPEVRGCPAVLMAADGTGGSEGSAG